MKSCITKKLMHNMAMEHANFYFNSVNKRLELGPERLYEHLSHSRCVFQGERLVKDRIYKGGRLYKEVLYLIQ